MPGRKGNDSDSESAKTEYAGTFETLRDEGEHFVHVAQYDRAIDSFSKALDLKAEDPQCLVARSQCYLQLGDAINSLEDAECALLNNPGFIKVIYQKAEALYLLGDFETALVFYHRGNKLRPELDEFRLGIQKSQQAVVNSIGTPESIKLKVNDSVNLNDFYQKVERSKKVQQKLSYQKPQIQTRSRSKPSSSDNERTVQQLLGEVYGDKIYLESLLKDDCVTGLKSSSSYRVRALITECLEYLDTRTDFWRQHKPLYARKRDLKLRLRGPAVKQRDPTKYILKQLELIEEAQANGRHIESLDRVEKVMKTVESWSDRDIANKAEVKANLHSLMGNAHLEMGEYAKALYHHNLDRDLANKYNLEEAKSRAIDNLGRVFARKGDYGQAVDIWSEKLHLEKTPQESTWLHHEIGRCYLEMTRYSEAREFGEKSFDAAQKVNDLDWQLNALVLIAQSEVNLGMRDFAIESFGRALDIAKLNGDKRAEEAIEVAIAEVNKQIAESVKSNAGDNAEDNYNDEKYEKDDEIASQQKEMEEVVEEETEIPEVAQVESTQS